jgi:hypothetical protein
MTTLRRSLVPILVSLAALTGCLDQPDVDSTSLEDSAAAAAATAPLALDTAVRVEQAERALDLGRDVAGARATLEAVVADKSAPLDLRDRAALSLSRACELGKDGEGAVRAIENLLAAHASDHEWPGKDAAEGRLRKLVTGKEARPSSVLRPEEKASPFARVLAGYYPEKKGEARSVTMLAFGGDSDVSEQLGTFNIRAALREKAQEACPLCDVNVTVHTSMSQSGSWTAIPAEKPRMDRAITLFYTHLGDLIPARYDSLLPMPMAEVTAHLQKGEALIVAAERPGAPPVILLAAPREAQLAEVEEALSLMKTLPTSAMVIKVAPGLKALEIRTVMRAAGMPQLKKCYDELLARVPTAAGKIDIGFGIRGDGTVEKVQLDTTETLEDARFRRCLVDATGTLRFAATGSVATVKYPLVFSP